MSDRFEITVNDLEVQALLQKLQAGLGDLRPQMQGIGELLKERTQRRFATSTDPMGNKWQPNAQATYNNLASGLGKSMRNKDGRVNKKGADKLAAKKPLIGETKVLSTQFAIVADADSVVFGTTSATKSYAAIQNFGGQAGHNKKVTIPARAFMPVMQSGEFYPDEQLNVMNLLSEYIDSVAGK